jgi:hypothetical protein
LLVAGVVGLGVVLTAVTALAGVALLLLVATLIRVGRPRLGTAVAGLLVAARCAAVVVVIRRGAVATTGRRAVRGLRGRAVAGRRLAVTLVVAAAVAGRRALLVAALARIALLVAALLRVAAAGRVVRIVRRGVPATVLGRVGAALLGSATTLLVQGTGVAVLVVVVGGPPLTLVAAVARVVAHRWYSWFCGERIFRLCWGGCACGRVGAGVRIDDATGTVLAGVQVLRLLEPDDDITIRLPPVFPEVSPQVSGKSVRGDIAVGVDLLEVGPTEGNDVLVGCQQTATLQCLHTIGGLPA